MKIIASLAEDGWHALGDASYEWWYFDALSTTGLGVVITFFYGLPFSPYYNKKISQLGETGADPRHHTAFYCSVYGERGTLCYALNEYGEKSFSAERDRPQVNIARSALNYDAANGYTITIDAPAQFGRHLSGEVTFRPQIFPTFSSNDAGTEHVWNCVAPRCEVKGALTIRGLLGKREINFVGTGYHDHNYGLRPMHLDMQRWHWGRLHTDTQTSIYYLIEKPHNQYEGLLTSITNNGETQYCGRLEYQATAVRHLMGVRYFPKIELYSEGVQLKVTNQRIVDQGPFYLRFLAEQELTLGREKDNKYCAIGFAEAFEPHRLFIKAFWPLIKTRIKRQQS